MKLSIIMTLDHDHNVLEVAYNHSIFTLFRDIQKGKNLEHLSQAMKEREEVEISSRFMNEGEKL